MEAVMLELSELSIGKKDVPVSNTTSVPVSNTTSVPVSNTTSVSKNSLVAKNGFRAESEFCLQESIKQSLEVYFELPIKSIERIPGRKKADIKIKFENGTETRIQTKDGNGGGRGWSVDRRPVGGFNDESLMTLLITLCLKQGTEKPTISDIISKMILVMCILGENEEEYPEYFTHTKSDKKTGEIIYLSICRADDLMKFMYKELYKVMAPKRTCVHLSPYCYLQRKGGGKTDHHPDDIQMKVKFNYAFEAGVYKTIFPQTKTE